MVVCVCVDHWQGVLMLVELLQHDKSSLVRAAAVAGLASTCGSRCSRLLLLTLNDTAKEVCETSPLRHCLCPLLASGPHGAVQFTARVDVAFVGRVRDQ